jgi:hypothetical protein
MIDAVVSVHTNPLTSGVAKFNAQLADHLQVPLVRYGAPSTATHPLVSVKCAEVAEANALAPHPVYSLFLHDWGGSFRDVHAVKAACQVYAANGVIARQVRAIRPDVLTAFCPSTVQGNWTVGGIDVLSFGMAHKFQGVHFERLKGLLDQTGRSYTVSVSTGIHEGSPWEPTFVDNERLMRGIFGDHLRVLGFLTDDALARELKTVTAVALFFEPAARANNTSLWAAIDAWCPVITNLDADSPPGLDRRVFPLATLTAFPVCARMDAPVPPVHPYTWPALTALLTAPVTV